MKPETEITHSVALRRQYCRELRRAMSFAPDLGKRCAAQMEESLASYLDEHPEATMEELNRVFGTPAQAAQEMLGNLDAAQIQKQMAQYRWRRIAARVIVGLVLAFSLLQVGRFLVDRYVNPPIVLVTGSAVVDEEPLPTDTPVN